MAMRTRFVIYCLSDPTTDELRYVGRSSSGMRRARGHTTPTSLKLQDHCHRWIGNLIKLGMKPIVEIVEECPSSAVDPNEWLNDAERFYISYFRSLGFRLTNETDGGMGLSGRKWSKEQTETMRRKLTGRKFSDETLKRMSESHMGKKPPPNSAFGSNYHRTMTNRKVKCVDDGNVFPSLKEAAQFYGTYSSNICHMISGKRSYAAGRRFEYVEGEKG